MALNARQVVTLKEPGRYGDGHGLCLQITPRGAKSWLLRYERNGRERWMGLGPLHTVSLKEARERARKARQQLLDGLDPLETRRVERAKAALEAAKTVTFKEAATAYFDAHQAKWKNSKHRAQFLSTLREYAFPKFGKLAVADIDLGSVLGVLEPIWPTKTETASRVRSRIEAVLDWAAVRKLRTGDNPARWKGHLQHVLPARTRLAKPQHHAALPYSDIPQFMAALRQRDGIAARALEFTILTAARTGEMIGGQWAEVDLAAKTWTVPGKRMKAGREHRVPLSDRAIEILKSVPREKDNPFIFIGPRAGGLSNMAMAAVLRRMDRAEVTVHGFRSTFRDWAAERTSYPNHVVEMALAHVVGNKVEAAYRRGDLFEKRRRLMTDWANYCGTPAVGKRDNVMPMRAL
ncbi:site-specific integrase [Bradyrhizobium sp. 169]|uniref:tyrosine-type recombinase/integrase n=1 Tax=Bradyrhizobium sp. 169 TaxID=2782640 RepID=UPI001FF7B639|nr:site-specific integrase [Bradyrhizobium sp. 169]MCK1586898.1 integrase arm-type DNA-binding domain-containing protein [Bradyrhizobium sp. 169]